MRGGGRRSPPLTRKSSGGELPHFDNLPARVNAGYNAVNRGVDGKFVSCNGVSNVQKKVAAFNDYCPRSLEGGLASMEEGEMLSTWSSDGRNGANSSLLEGRQQAHARGDVLDVMAMEAQSRGDVVSAGLDTLRTSNCDSSPLSPAVGSENGGLEVEETNGSTLRTAAVCLNADNKISCTSAGNDDRIASNLMDDGGESPLSQSPTHSPPHVDVERSLDDDEMGEPSSFPAQKMAVPQRDSNYYSSTSAEFTAWNKPGVSPLPSLKDLPHLKPLDGAARLDEDEVNAYISRFDGALVGRLFGRHIPFFHLNAELQRRWDRFGCFKLMTLSNECFICFFESTKARDAVLMGGPWIIAGQVIGLDRWTPGFSPSTSHGFTTPVWVRFPELPFYCWGRKNLASISSLLGEPLWVDDATLNLSKGSYARVCIKIDLSQPLLPHISIIGTEGTFQQLVEYEGLSTFCAKCGRVGHKIIHCNPSLAAGGRVEAGKMSYRSMNKAKSIGRTSIFAFSATNNTSSSPVQGKEAAHHASSKKKDTPTPTWRPPQVPENEEDQNGAGPWKIVPPRRRGRRSRQRPVQESAAVRDMNSSPPPLDRHQMQAQEAEQPPNDMEQLPDNSEHCLEAEEQPNQQVTKDTPLTTFTHKMAPFTAGSGGPPRGMGHSGNKGQMDLSPISRDKYIPIDSTGKFKKRRPATSSDAGDAASLRPP